MFSRLLVSPAQERREGLCRGLPKEQINSTPPQTAYVYLVPESISFLTTDDGVWYQMVDDDCVGLIPQASMEEVESLNVVVLIVLGTEGLPGGVEIKFTLN